MQVVASTIKLSATTDAPACASSGSHGGANHANPLCPFLLLSHFSPADVVERQVLLLHPSMHAAPASSTEAAGGAAHQGRLRLQPTCIACAFEGMHSS